MSILRISWLLALTAPAILGGDEPVEVHVQSYDGAAIGAAFRKPAGDGPFPAILFIHGGLGGSGLESMVRFTRNPVPDHFFKLGYVVLSTDYRRYHFGEDEIQDVAAAYRHLANLPFVNRDRIGVIGGSHGGYLTMMLATRYSPAAVVSFAGLSDIEEMFFEQAQAMRKSLKDYDDWQKKLFANKNARSRSAQRADQGKAPGRKRADRKQPRDPTTPNGSASFEVALDLAWRLGDDREAFQRISPVHNASKISCPILYVVGGEDRLRTAGKRLIDLVKERGVTAEYSEHAGMGHGFYWGTRTRNNQPPQYLDALGATTEFMNRHIMKDILKEHQDSKEGSSR